MIPVTSEFHTVLNMKIATFFWGMTLVERHQGFGGIFCSIFYLERGGTRFLRKEVSIYLPDYTERHIPKRQQSSNMIPVLNFPLMTMDLYSIAFYKIFQRNKCLMYSALFGNENLQYKLRMASRPTT
jgi:hypothetical protein